MLVQRGSMNQMAASGLLCRGVQDPVAGSWSYVSNNLVQDARQPATSAREPDASSSTAGCSTSRAACCLSSPGRAQRRCQQRARRVSSSLGASSRGGCTPLCTYGDLVSGSPRRETVPLVFDPLGTSRGIVGSAPRSHRPHRQLNGGLPGNGGYRHLVQARLKNDDSDRSQQNPSSASVFTPGSSFKFNRLDSTLPLSANASSFKASVRVLYSLATHGGLIAFGCLICQLTGTSVTDMIHLDSIDAVKGLLLAVPPILLASFLQLESLVQSWEVARGVRDAEDEELVEYYLGMTPSQYIPVAVASAVSQEVFFRAALQGGLALAFHLGGTAGLEGNLMHDLGAPSAVGMAAVSGFFPAFAPFSQLHAAVVMAAMTGSFDYATSMRSVPNVIVTDGRNLQAFRATFGEWYQRQQLKSIYAPMFTSLLALYFGLEWILVGNLMTPMISHSLYLAWAMMAGLARLDRSK